MRKCGNCYNGHYCLSNRGEELYCDESEFMEEEVNEDGCCSYHRYYEGYEEEKNYLFYDDSYLGPGYFVINTIHGKMNSFIKIYNMSEEGFPMFAIRGYQKGLKDNPYTEFTEMHLSFRDIEDDENGLYNAFTDLCDQLSENVYSIDQFRNAKNHLKLTTNGRVTTLSLLRDVYYGDHSMPDYFDIIIGDDVTCINYDIIFSFYQELARICHHKLSSEETKKLLLTK